MTRTWTATIQVYDRRASTMTEIAADDSEWDLLRDQASQAVREAALLGVLSDGYDVEVVLWKRTQARGLERDRSYRPYLDRRGVLRYSR